MSIRTLYKIIRFEYNSESGVLNSTVELNPSHSIFEGHFPGNPILPGVCTLQIAKELLSKALEGNYRLSKASMIKYLGFVNPVTNPEITFQHVLKAGDNGTVHCTVTVIAAGTTICSFKAEFIGVGPGYYIE